MRRRNHAGPTCKPYQCTESVLNRVTGYLIGLITELTSITGCKLGLLMSALGQKRT
jgi:hypothetical protein